MRDAPAYPTADRPPWRTAATGSAAGSSETVGLEGSVHVVTRVFPPDPVRLYVNLVGVEGVGQVTGQRYLGLGAVSLQIAFPPDPIIPLTFVIVPVGSQAHPPDPAFPPSPFGVLLTLDFNPDTGELIGVEAKADPALPGN